MAQLQKRFIGANQVDETKILLSNAAYIRSLQSDGITPQNILRVNASNLVEFASLPQLPSDAAAANDAVRYSFLQSYVAGIISGVQWKAPVNAVATSAITLSGTQTIDGVALVAGILVIAQADQTTNGVYVVAAGAWARSTDSNSAALLAGMVVEVESGTVGTGKVYVITAAAPLTLGTTNLTFTTVNGATVTGDGINSKVTGSVISSAQNFAEQHTLLAGEITGQAFLLSHLAANGTVNLAVSGVVQTPAVDFSTSVSGSVTQVNLLGDLATGGNAALISGDKVLARYDYLA
jgi:hypothetical protein